MFFLLSGSNLKMMLVFGHIRKGNYSVWHIVHINDTSHLSQHTVNTVVPWLHSHSTYTYLCEYIGMWSVWSSLHHHRLSHIVHARFVALGCIIMGLIMSGYAARKGNYSLFPWVSRKSSVSSRFFSIGTLSHKHWYIRLISYEPRILIGATAYTPTNI